MCPEKPNLRMKKKNIGTIIWPSPSTGETTLKGSTITLMNLVDILHSISSKLSIICGENDNYFIIQKYSDIDSHPLIHKSGSNTFSRVIKYIFTQFKISLLMIRHFKDVDIIISIYTSGFPIPMLSAKLMRKKILFMCVGNTRLELVVNNDPLLMPMMPLLMIDFILADYITLYSENLIDIMNLNNFKKKIVILRQHYYDLDKFNVCIKFGERPNIIGYIGRFSEEKGILSFVNSIPLVYLNRNDLSFLIAGDGILKTEILKNIQEMDLNKIVSIIDWIPYDELHKSFNNLKLLVLPSYTEGLPSVMLEAMACGTPVLVTPVGAIPDLIIDGETGFLMENNSPECIATNVLRALEHPDLEGVAQRARALVEHEFTFERAVERWRKVLDEVCNDER